MRPWLAIGKWILGATPMMAGPPGHHANPLDTPTASLPLVCSSIAALTTIVDSLRDHGCTCKNVSLRRLDHPHDTVCAR
jgi:hypothetical protein